MDALRSGIECDSFEPKYRKQLKFTEFFSECVAEVFLKKSGHTMVAKGFLESVNSVAVSIRELLQHTRLERKALVVDTSCLRPIEKRIALLMSHFNEKNSAEPFSVFLKAQLPASSVHNFSFD